MKKGHNFSTKSVSRIAVLSVLILVGFVTACSKDEEETGQKFHEVKEYVITYKMPEGEKTIYSQNWGRCVAQVTENRKTISLMEGEDQYVVTIDLENKTGTKMQNPIYKSLIEQIGAKDPKEFNMAILEKMGGKIVGEKEILGNKCDEWELMNGAQKSCITEDGIILEIGSNMGGTQRVEVATKLQRDTKGGLDACDTSGIELEEVDIQEMFQRQQPAPQPETGDKAEAAPEQKSPADQKPETENSPQEKP